MSTLRILQISTKDLGGGAEGSAWNLFRAFRERGHKSWLAVGRKQSADPDVFEIPRLRPVSPHARLCWTLIDRLSPCEGKVRGVWRLNYWLRKLAGGWPEFERDLGREYFNYPGTRQLLNLVPQRPHIIHAHNLHGGYFDLRFLATLSHQVPVILNLRDMWLLTGHCAYSLGCERWKTGCGKCPDLSLYPAIKRDATVFNWRRKCRIYAQSHLYITAVSQWLMDQVNKSMLKGIQYRMIPNAIDLAVFKQNNQREARARLTLPANARIVMLSAQSKFKDYDGMIDCLRRLKMPFGSELLFICLGKTEEDHIVGKGRIIYPGFIRDPYRMALYYSASDIFLHAAKDEAFGKTIAEAMACGIPVVATSVGGIPELIENGITGYLVPRGNSTAMTQRIQLLLNDISLRKHMGDRAASIAHKRFDLNRQVDDFLTWYEEILDCEANQNDLPNIK